MTNLPDINERYITSYACAFKLWGWKMKIKMVYKSSINAKLRLEGDSLSAYERYSKQSTAVLSKNEHGFADEKRTRGAMAQAFDEKNFRFEYPVFKTPEIPEELLLKIVLDKINDPGASMM